MNSIVTQRFLQCFEKIRKENRVRSGRQFALSLDYLPQSLSSMLKDRRDVPLETLRKAVEKYRFNPNFIFTGQGPMMLGEDENKFRVLSVMTDQNGEERIVHVPVPAQAGYANESSEQTFIQGLPSFSLPDYKYKVGTHRSFDVAGDSMEPTLVEGDKVICSFLEPSQWENGIKNNHVYVFVTKSDVVVKRAVNHIKCQGTLELHSDNTFYQPFTLALSDLKEVWYIRSKISPFAPSPNKVSSTDVSRDEINELKSAIQKQNDVINKLYEAIDKINPSTKDENNG